MLLGQLGEFIYEIQSKALLIQDEWWEIPDKKTESAHDLATIFYLPRVWRDALLSVLIFVSMGGQMNEVPTDCTFSITLVCTIV